MESMKMETCHMAEHYRESHRSPSKDLKGRVFVGRYHILNGSWSAIPKSHYSKTSLLYLTLTLILTLTLSHMTAAKTDFPNSGPLE